MELNLFQDIFRNFLEVFFILHREDDVFDSGPERADGFLLDAADGGNTSAEIDFAGHGVVGADRPSGEKRNQRGRERDTGGRAVLGSGAVRDMDMEIAFCEKGVVDAKLFAVSLDVAEGGDGAFLHDVAEGSGELEFALAGHGNGLDLKDGSADAGPCHSGGDADFRFLHGFIHEELAGAEKGMDLGHINHGSWFIALCPPRFRGRACGGPVRWCVRAGGHRLHGCS